MHDSNKINNPSIISKDVFTRFSTWPIHDKDKIDILICEFKAPTGCGTDCLPRYIYVSARSQIA